MFGEEAIEDGVGIHEKCDNLTQTAVKEYAFQLCKKMIATLASQCEFKTYENGIFKKNHDYYRLNIEPNNNQDAFTFWQKVVEELLTNGNCLIIPMNDGYYIATGHDRKTYQLKENEYHNVKVGVPLIQKVMPESKVIYLSLSEEDLRLAETKSSKMIDEVFHTIKEQYQLKKYNKIILEKTNHQSQVQGRMKAQEEKDAEIYSNFINSKKNSMISMPNGMQLGKVESRMGEGYVDDAPNIQSFFESILTITASTYFIDPDLLKGKSVNLEPFVKMYLTGFLKPIERELNRKLYGEKQLLNNTYIEIDPSKLLQADPLTVAKTNDIKLRSGTHSINDLLMEAGRSRIEQSWADEHYITLNYAPARMFTDEENKPKALKRREKKANEQTE